MSVKDPVWKYKWVERNEPEIFKRVYKWLDVKDYLIARCTGNISRTADSAFSTFLYDTRRGKEGWNTGLCRMYGVDPAHLPDIIECTDVAGRLREEAARELGLPEGIPVFGGALSQVFCQMLADITGRVIEVPHSPQNVGAAGAAVLIALGTGLIDSPEKAVGMVPVMNTYRPNEANRAVYERSYTVFKGLYKSNAKEFKIINGMGGREQDS